VIELNCAAVEELASELALGTLPGDQRPAVLSHLDGCSPCRLLIHELSDRADLLLLAAPEVQPPPGFARRVTRGFRARRRAHWRPAGAVAAVAFTVGLLVGFLPGRLNSGTVPVRTAHFVSMSEPVSGEAYVRGGDPPWVFMTVKDSEDTPGGNQYACELVLTDGQHVSIGSFPLRYGRGSWGRSVQVDVSQIRSVLLLEPNGATVASANLSPG
jgi:hypothetical protein